MKTADILLVFALSGFITLHGLSQQPPNAAYTMKSWHSPKDTSKIDSQIFGVVTWEQLSKIKVGMPVAELKKLVELLSPFGNADALIYSNTPENIPYEIELKFSPEGVVSDISYRAIPSRPSIQVTGHEFTVPTSFRTLAEATDVRAKPAAEPPLSLATVVSDRPNPPLKLWEYPQPIPKTEPYSWPVPVTARLWKREHSMAYFKIVAPELLADGVFMLMGENPENRIPENTLCKILLPVAAANEIAGESDKRQAARRWVESGRDPTLLSYGFLISKVLASDLSSPPEIVVSKTVK